VWRLRGPHPRRIGPAILPLCVRYNIGRGRLVPVPLEVLAGASLIYAGAKYIGIA